MQKLVLSVFAALLAGTAVAVPAEAAFYQRGYGHITPAERAAFEPVQRNRQGFAHVQRAADDE